MLERAGAKVWRVGFNRGDRAFWGGDGFIPYRGTQEDWPAALRAILVAKAITDIVLYGDTRFIHAEAVRRASELGWNVELGEDD